MKRFEVYETALAGLKVIQRKPIMDARGFLCRIYCVNEFESFGFSRPIDQINHTCTHKIGAVRGLHFQYPPRAEVKIVICLKGEVFDVAVDLRHGSPTFLQWHAEILSDRNSLGVLIPEGFAHGFQALSLECELLYLHTEIYDSSSVGAVNVKDPALKIPWPLDITDISENDLNHPMLIDSFEGIFL